MAEQPEQPERTWDHIRPGSCPNCNGYICVHTSDFNFVLDMYNSKLGKLYVAFSRGKLPPTILFNVASYKDPLHKFYARFAAFNSEPEGLRFILNAPIEGGYTLSDYDLVRGLCQVNTFYKL